MYQKVKAYMKEHGMVVDGDVVLAGVSGGGDSMAMLEMLKRYQAEAAFSLCAVHVHHGIRGCGGNFAPQSLQRNGAERSGFYFAGAG